MVWAGTILLNYCRLSICELCSYLWKTCRSYAFQFHLLSMSKKDKDKCDFQRRVFCFYRFRLNLALRKVLYLLLFIDPKLASIMEVRQSVFRTQSNIYNGAKIVKHFVIFNPWKVPWNWTTFYWNSSFTSPGLIRDKTEGKRDLFLKSYYFFETIA